MQVRARAATPAPADRTRTPPDKRRKSGGGRALGKIEVHQRLEDAEPFWNEMESLAPCSAYQSRAWVRPWIETLGRACGVHPMLIAARDKAGRAVAFLPFGVIDHEKIRIAGFLGGQSSNCNIGLFRPDASFSQGDLESLFRAAALRSSRRPDAFVLAHQPQEWEGAPNPLALLPRQASPSFGHSTLLSRDFKAYAAAHLSADSRKKLAKKRKRLEKDLGEVRHAIAGDAGEVRDLLDAFFAQKLARFRLLGIASEFDHPSARDFIERASLQGLATGKPTLENHALVAGGRIVAVYGGAHWRGRFHAMYNSFDMTEEAARCSPGDLLLASMLERMGEAGVACFDLGVGEARYKAAWCETTQPLFDTIVPVTARGRAFALAEAARLTIKRQVKQNPFLWSLAQRLRASLSGSGAEAA